MLQTINIFSGATLDCEKVSTCLPKAPPLPLQSQPPRTVRGSFSPSSLSSLFPLHVSAWCCDLDMACVPPPKGSWAGISFPLGGNKKAEFNPALIFRGEPFTMTHKVIPVGVQDEALWLNPSGLIRKDVRGCRLMHGCLWPQVLLRTLSTRRYNLDHGHPER